MGLDQEHCLCGTHVSKGAQIIASLNLIFSSSGLLRAISSYHVDLSEESPSAFIVPLLLNIAASALLLYGNKKRRSGFYIPYMVLQIFYCISLIAFVGLYIFFDIMITVLFLTGDDSSIESALKYEGYFPGVGESPAILAFWTSIILFVTWLCWYLLSVVFRDYKLIRAERSPVIPKESREEREKVDV